MSNNKIKVRQRSDSDVSLGEGLPLLNVRQRSDSDASLGDGLPREAFAIMGDPDDPETWTLPHHKKSILRALMGKLDIEKTVDWDRMPAAVAALSPGGYRGQRVQATEGEKIDAARHLANHYKKAGRPLPDTLAVII